MKFVKFQVYELDGRGKLKFSLTNIRYINIDHIKIFEVRKYKAIIWPTIEGSPAIEVSQYAMLLNNDKDFHYRNLRFRPFDKDQFKEAFGFDWMNDDE